MTYYKVITPNGELEELSHHDAETIREVLGIE